MLAHCAVRAEEDGADFGGREVLPAKPNTWQTPVGQEFRWKSAYRMRFVSMGLKAAHQGFMRVLVDVSDSYGRVWWGQTSLAKRAGCNVRTLRRYCDEFKRLGLLRVEKQTFKSLAAAQQSLGLPLPERRDDGQAPNLLTLLIDGEQASSSEAMYSSNRAPVHRDKPRQDKPRPSVARTVPVDHFVQGEPRTKTPDIPPDKMADDLQGSTLLTRDVEGDPEEQPRPTLVVEEGETVAAQNSLQSPAAPPGVDAWAVLSAAYDAQYRRVYKSTPTTKFMTAENKQALILHVEEMTAVFEDKLRGCGVDVGALGASPMKVLADEALRAWFDSQGGNGFLRRVSHRMRELVQDLPHRMRRAIESLIAQHAPKPAPRKVSVHVAETAHVAVGRRIVRDKLVPATLPMPTIHAMHAVVSRPERPRPPPTISQETQFILDGLSARKPLEVFADDAAFARELEALARASEVWALRTCCVSWIIWRSWRR